MRIEIAGAEITDSVVDVLETLQTQPEITNQYLKTLDEITRSVILDISTADDEADVRIMSQLRALQMIRHDIVTLSSPPDVDDPANDKPTASF